LRNLTKGQRAATSWREFFQQKFSKVRSCLNFPPCFDLPRKIKMRLIFEYFFQGSTRCRELARMIHDFMGVGVGQQSWVVVVNDSPLRVSPSDRVRVN